MAIVHDVGWMMNGGFIIFFSAEDGNRCFQFSPEDAYQIADYINQHRVSQMAKPDPLAMQAHVADVLRLQRAEAAKQGIVFPNAADYDGIDPKTEPEILEPPSPLFLPTELLSYATGKSPFSPPDAARALSKMFPETPYKQVYNLVYQELKKNPRYAQDIETRLWSYKRGPGRPKKADKIRESAEMTPKALKAASKGSKK